jgi:hypothetical protein
MYVYLETLDTINIYKPIPLSSALPACHYVNLYCALKCSDVYYFVVGFNNERSIVFVVEKNPMQWPF